MSRLRLLADDLTGALEAAAQFTGLLGPVTVRFRSGDWRRSDRHLAYDAATRELDERATARAMWRLARFYANATIPFKRIDSLLRGHPALELERSFRLGSFASCAIAPAFPARGCVTRRGLQHARERDGTWRPVAPGFADELRLLGLDLKLAGGPDQIAGEGVFLCDAETDDELAAVVVAVKRLAPPLLWCGSAGLARALAGVAPPLEPVPAQPLLAIVGSHHPVARAQLDRVEDAHPELWIAVREGAAEADEVRECLAARGAALLTFLLPDYMFEAEAARRLAATLGELLPRLEQPAGLFVSGGETLRATAAALRAEAFDVTGEVALGVPASRLRGGLWEGVPVVSKSGAVGDAELLARVLSRPGEPLEE